MATTHLLFSPKRREVRLMILLINIIIIILLLLFLSLFEVRLAQTALMLATIDKLAWDGESYIITNVKSSVTFNEEGCQTIALIFIAWPPSSVLCVFHKKYYKSG